MASISGRVPELSDDVMFMVLCRLGLKDRIRVERGLCLLEDHSVNSSALQYSYIRTNI